MANRSDFPSLAGMLLVAMPTLNDPSFNGRVILLADHTPSGAMGLVLNDPMQDMPVDALLQRIELNLELGVVADGSVMQGGPVHPQRGFVLHEETEAWASTLRVPEGMGLTTSRDVLEALARGGGPDRYRIFLGYCGWGPGQLEVEIAASVWLTVPHPSPELIFDASPETMLTAAYHLMGINPLHLSGSVGHA